MTSSVLLSKASTGILVAHLVATFIDNLPDGRLALGQYVPPIGKIPQWKFFAPNPGVDDIHIMYRTSSDSHEAWSRWREYSTEFSRTPLSFLWNPRSRRPKAIFDIANQLRIMSGFPWSYPVAINSPGYKLLVNEVKLHCLNRSEDETMQVMILSSKPGQGRDGISPILVSPEIVIGEK